MQDQRTTIIGDLLTPSNTPLNAPTSKATHELGYYKEEILKILNIGRKRPLTIVSLNTLLKRRNFKGNLRDIYFEGIKQENPARWIWWKLK